MSAQDKLDRRAAKHGLGSDERKRKIQKAKDFFSKPVPTYSKDELRKMGHPVETTDAEVKKKQDFLDRLRGKPPVKAQKEGMFDIEIPAPKGKSSNPKATARNRANSAKHADKIKKAMAKDIARSASGSLKRTDDHRRKNYQSGKAGAYFSKYENVEEKAVSKSQQKFMGMVRAVQKGDMKQAPSPEVAKAAKTMSKKDVKDFASTKHKGLPESSVEYGKSMDRIKDKEKNAAIKPKDRETLGKLADLMKKQKRTNEEKMYSVKYTHPTDKKSGKTTGPLSKAAADKKAAMGNRVDRVGGKYTVIPHVEAAGQEYTAVPIKTGDVSQADRLTIAKMDAIMKKRSKDKRQKESVNLEENKIFFVKVGTGRDHMTVKVKAPNSREALKKMRAQHPKNKVALDQNQKQGRSAGALESVETNESSVQENWRADSARRMRNQRIANEPYRGPSEPDTRTDAERMADRAKLAKRFAADKAKQDKAVASKKESVELDEISTSLLKRARDKASKNTVDARNSASRNTKKYLKNPESGYGIKALKDYDKADKSRRQKKHFDKALKKRSANESVATADKKPQNYRDPETGKLMVRMVPVDRDVVRGDDKARVVRKKRFKHMRKEQMATGNSRVGKDGRDAFMKAFKDIQKTAAEIQKKKDADKK